MLYKFRMNEEIDDEKGIKLYQHEWERAIKEHLQIVAKRLEIDLSYVTEEVEAYKGAIIDTENKGEKIRIMAIRHFAEAMELDIRNQIKFVKQRIIFHENNIKQLQELIDVIEN